jgi:STE24 endopeptidase
MAALVIYWHTVYPLESASRDRMLAQAALAGQPVLAAWSRRDYLSFNIRCNLLFVLAPVALIMLALGVLGRLSRWAPDSAVMAAGVAATLGVFLVTPTIMVWLWGTRPLPESPLRSSLEAFCRRVGLTYRRIVLWPTGGAVVNAGVMGLVRPMRYVLLSDGLLAGMSQPAVEAVFAHEAGHVVHKHILYLMLFSIGTLTLLTTALEEVLKLARIELTMRWELAVALVAASGWLFLFGLISRRFERQADVFAACSIRLRRTPGCAATADTCSTAAPGCADNSSPFQGEGGPQGRVRVGPGPTADTCSTAALGCAPPVDPANPAEGGWATSSSPRLTLEGVTQFSSALEQVALLNGHFLTQWNFRHGSILSRIDHLHRLLHADSALTRYNRWSLALRFAILTLFAAGLACTLLSYAGW